MEKNFKASELVRITKLSRKTIDNYIHSGKLSTVLEGGRKVVPVSEVMRVFPYITVEELEGNSSPSSSSIATSPKEVDNSSEVFALKGRVKELEVELNFTKKLLELYEVQIAELRADKERLEERHKDYVGVVELLKRGLPMRSSPARRTPSGERRTASPSTPPARDKYGRFVSGNASVEVVEVEEV